ncbi:MAG: hypothetical protein Fur0046_05130 [Cyanobacteria bacterium J069]
MIQGEHALRTLMADSLTIPSDLSFEQAIALTQDLMAQMEAGTLSAVEEERAIAALVASENGARGFFVTYLTSDSALADAPSEAVVKALQSSPETVAELLVKNVAMSSAMAIAHRRNQNEDMAQGSERVSSRTADLIRRVSLPLVSEKAQQLRDSAQTGAGVYADFLNRWHYDDEQRTVIQAALSDI